MSMFSRSQALTGVSRMAEHDAPFGRHQWTQRVRGHRRGTRSCMHPIYREVVKVCVGPWRKMQRARRTPGRPDQPVAVLRVRPVESTVNHVIDYYLAPQSPWTYLGHQRFADIARAAGARINVLPFDLGGKVFPFSGGLPLAKRAPQRQAYRLVELKRFSEHLGLPLNLKPKFFPVNGDDAARLIIALELNEGSDAAMAIAGAVLRAVWAEERNIADEPELAAILVACKLPAKRLDDAHSQEVQERYEANSQRAIDAGVFGAPSYVIAGEIFWGQDRLDFVQRRLK